MKKLIICKYATCFFGLLAVWVLTGPDTVAVYEGIPGNIMGAGLVLLGGIFGSQWVEYQRRQDEVSNLPTWPGWLRHLLF